MNNSILFKRAHAEARKTVKLVGNYQIAFTLALKALYAEKQVKEVSITDYHFFISMSAFLLTILSLVVVYGINALPIAVITGAFVMPFVILGTEALELVLAGKTLFNKYKIMWS